MDAFLAPFIKSARAKRPAGRRTTNKGQAAGSSGVVVSIFDVPPGLLARAGPQDGASPPSSAGQTAAEGSRTASTEARSDGAIAPAADARGLTCNRCGLNFGDDDRAVQVQHFKSDLHMANLRRQLAGKPRITQAQLDDETAAAAAKAAAAAGDGAMGSAAAAEAESSSSGTDSDEGQGATERGLLYLDGVEEEEDAGDGGLLSAVGAGGGAGNGGTGNGDPERGRVKVDFSLQEGPRLTFVPRGSAWAFSLSSAALGMERGDDPWARLDSLVGAEGENRLWAVVILRSGKFAAAVFEGQAVVCHKVFRRYTIRAKRGGSQSSYDSGGRKAQSAGAALRRYGEQALREDARALLKEWEGPLKACRVVLTSVPKGMRAVLFEGKEAPFDRKDGRLRPVPFAVGKPVFEEVVAVHTRVTSIVFSDAAAIPAGDPGPASNKEGSGRDSVSSKQAKKQAKAAAGVEVAGPPVARRFDEEACPPSMELLEACEQGDVDAAAALLDRLDLTAAAAVAGDAPGTGGAAAGAAATGWTAGEVLNHPDGFERLMTPLHVAAAGGHVAVLGMLLERGASPLAEDVRGRVPYLLAPNKDTRDAFRRARAGQPETWDWDAARVPEPLTEELEQRKKEKLKEKEKEKKRRAKLRKKAEKSKAEEEARQKKEKEEAEAEDRRKRGLAAAGHCDACGKALVAKKAFSRFEFRYCSSDCANLHKRKLAADAAERRFNGGGAGVDQK
ncbi:unnamed protein product [Ectocarpus fasciculatus]